MTLDLSRLSASQTEHLNRIANRLMKPYTCFVDECSKKYGDNYLYWATPFASRNINNDNDTFLSLCRIFLALEIAREIQVEKIITVSWAEKSILKKNLPKRIKIQITSNGFKFITRIIEIAHGLRVCVDEVFYIFFSNKYSKPQKGMHLSFLIMPVLSGYFDGLTFNDRYFTGITEFRDVTILPYLSNSDHISSRDFIHKIENCLNYHFLNGYSFARIKDLLEIIRYWKYLDKIKHGVFVFDDMDVSPLIIRCLQKGKWSTPAFTGLLMRRKLWRIKVQTEILIDNCLVWYEGRPNDVLISSTVRDFFPECNCVGYEAFPIPEIDPSLQISDFQCISRHCPNIMAIPSEVYKTLSRRFCPNIQLCYIPFLRTEYVLRKKREGGTVKKILLVFPIHEDVATDILQELEHFMQTTSYTCKVYAKPHPTWSKKTLRRIKLDSLSYSTEIVYGTLNACLDEMDLVVTSLSTSTLEVVFSGIPLIIVYPKNRLGFTALPKYLCDGLYQAVTLDELHDIIDPWLKKKELDNSALAQMLVVKNEETVGRMFK